LIDHYMNMHVKPVTALIGKLFTVIISGC